MAKKNNIYYIVKSVAKVSLWKRFVLRAKEYIDILSEGYEDRYERKHEFDLKSYNKAYKKF